MKVTTVRNSILILICSFFISFCSVKNEKVVRINKQGVFYNDISFLELTSDIIGQVQISKKRIYDNTVSDSVIYQVSDFHDSGISFHIQEFVNEKEAVKINTKEIRAKKMVVFLDSRDEYERFKGKVKLFGTEINKLQNTSLEEIQNLIPEKIETKKNDLYYTLSFYLNDIYVTLYFNDFFSKLEGLIINNYPNVGSY